MNNIIIYIGAGLGSLWLLWVFFLAVMALKRANDDGAIHKGSYTYYLAMSVLFVGWVLDFVVNMTVATVLFLEVPFELTLTARCEHYMSKIGYRGNMARRICKLLDPFQIGGHCHD